MDSRIQSSSHYYARFAEPLDPDKGWQREDVQLAFAFGMKEQSIRQLLGLKEVANLLAVSVSTVRDLVHHGELAYVKVGRGTERNHLAFAPAEIESFIKRHTQRDQHVAASKPTCRVTTRKGKFDLAIERATAQAGRFDFAAERAKLKKK